MPPFINNIKTNNMSNNKLYKITLIVNEQELSKIEEERTILFAKELKDQISQINYKKYSDNLLNTIQKLFGANLKRVTRRFNEYEADFSFMFSRIMRDISEHSTINDKIFYLNGVRKSRKITKTKYLLSYRQIGEYINKDHSTIIHGLNQFDDFYETDKIFKKNYDLLITELNK